MLMKKLSIAAAGVVFTGTAWGFSSLAWAQSFKQIYVFGDSLSDVGNVFQSTQRNVPPSPPYFQGRYCNGPVWVEYLAPKLGLTSNSDTNFAFGGATTGGYQGASSGLLAQIKRFTTNNTSADAKALYIVWAGANDYLTGTNNSTTPINNLILAVKSLSELGAKNIVVVNLPDLGKLPATRNSYRSDLLNNLTQEHNSQLAAALNKLHQQLSSDSKITYLDVNSRFNQVINEPQKFGFTNVTEPCLSEASICINPNEYLFWDDIHPTTAAHKLFVELAFWALNPAPPPANVFNYTSVLVSAIVVGALGAGLIYSRKRATKS